MQALRSENPKINAPPNWIIAKKQFVTSWPKWARTHILLLGEMVTASVKMFPGF